MKSAALQFLCLLLLCGHVVWRTAADSTTILAASVRNETFWKSLSPELHIYDVTYFANQNVFEEYIVNSGKVLDLIWKEGYAQLDPLSWNVPIDSMVAIIETLHQRKIPITFCFMYDEFWYMFMRLHHTLGHVLGADYKRLPDFWAWRVDPRKAERGWTVHRDKNFETLYRNGLPKSLSVWVPLTDATTSNGCMYVVPADRDPTYRKAEMLTEYWESIAPDIRALPIAAGGALIWNQMVWHWGSRSNSRGTQPRYSLAVEFQAAPTPDEAYPNQVLDSNGNRVNAVSSDGASGGVSSGGSVGDSGAGDISGDGNTGTPGTTASAQTTANLHTSKEYTDLYGDTVPHFNDPLSHPLRLPPFPERLQLVAKQILQYRHMYPLTAEVEAMAEDILLHPPV